MPHKPVICDHCKEETDIFINSNGLKFCSTDCKENYIQKECMACGEPCGEHYTFHGFVFCCKDHLESGKAEILELEGAEKMDSLRDMENEFNPDRF